MVSVDQNMAATSVAPEILQRRREAAQLQQANQVKPTEAQPGDWLYGVIVGDTNTDDFIYGPDGTLSTGVSTAESARPDFWVREPADELKLPDGPVTKPWERTWVTKEDFVDGLHDYLRSMIKQPKTAEDIEAIKRERHLAAGFADKPAATSDPATDAKMAAMKMAEVKDQVPKRVHDLLLYTGALNSLIARTNSTEYQTDEHYKANIDKFIDKFKGLVTGAYSYISQNADIQGVLIKANDDGTYSNPAFTLSYQGQVLYNHPDE